MAENEKRCAFCGAEQKRLSNDDYETKKCKKCDRDIYVNANFCPYCGTDQAILDLNKDLPNSTEDDISDENETDHNNQANLTRQQKLEQSLLNTNLDDEDSLNKFVKQMNDAGIKVRVVKPEEKNENVHPGIMASTKLMIKDTFKINKRMGINDYWWGFAGMLLIAFIFATILATILVSMHMKEAVMLKTAMSIMMPFIIAYQFILFTATWRRLHDMNMSGVLMFFWLFGPFGRLALAFLCLMGPRLDNNPYTFDVHDYQKNKDKMRQ